MRKIIPQISRNARKRYLFYDPSANLMDPRKYLGATTKILP